MTCIYLAPESVGLSNAASSLAELINALQLTTGELHGGFAGLGWGFSWNTGPALAAQTLHGLLLSEKETGEFGTIIDSHRKQRKRYLFYHKPSLFKERWPVSQRESWHGQTPGAPVLALASLTPAWS